MTTLNKIAELSGVSISTVSRVINRDPRISDATAERIRKTITKIGYTPKIRRPETRFSRANNHICTHNVALVEFGDCVNVHTPLVHQIRQGLATRLAEYGMSLISAIIRGNTIPRCLSEQQVDGIVVSGMIPEEIVKRLQKFPAVWLSSRHTANGDYVVGGHTTSGQMAANYLIEKGHRRLAFINLWSDHPANRARAEGFEFTAHKAGIAVELIESAFEDPQQPSNISSISYFVEIEKSLAVLVDRLLEISPRPTGLFVPLDMFTAIIYRLLNKRNIKLGRDIEIISCNNEIPYLAGLYPRPATIDIGGKRIGESAADQLLSRIQFPNDANGLRLVVEPIIIEGESINDNE